MNSNKLFIIIILSFSLLLRLGIAYQLKDSFLDRGNRSSSINPIAENLIEKHEYSIIPGSPTASTEPLYPFFVAIAYYLINAKWFSIASLQSTLVLLNGLVVFHLALLLFKNDKISLLSLLLFCFYPYYITQSISVSDTMFFSFWLCLSTYLTIYYSPKDNFYGNLIVGGTWGLTLLTRFSAVSLFPFVFLYYLLNRPFRRGIKGCIIILIGCILTISPWVYRNYVLTDKFFIVTSRGAISIWFGYNNDTLNIIQNDISVDRMRRGLNQKIPELKEISRKQYPASINREVEEGIVFVKHAIKFAKNNPLLSMKMMPIKLWKFWSWYKNPIPNSLNPDMSDTPLMRLWCIVYTVSYLPILILGVAGMILNRHNWRIHSIFYLIFIGYSILHMIVFGFSRLRVPLDQFLIIFAAYSAICLFENSKI